MYFRLKVAIAACLIMVSNAGFGGQENGLVTLPSAFSTDETQARLLSKLKEKGMTVFAVIDHQNGAKTAGLNLNPSKVVVFGNPNVGTRLMNCDPTTAIDLPQKALIWTGEDGATFLTYNHPQYLAQRHNLADCGEVLNKVDSALSMFAKFATTTDSP